MAAVGCDRRHFAQSHCEFVRRPAADGNLHIESSAIAVGRGPGDAFGYGGRDAGWTHAHAARAVDAGSGFAAISRIAIAASAPGFT